MYTGTLIEDLGKTVATVDGLEPVRSAPVPCPPDYVSYDECVAEAEKQMAADCPDIEQKMVNGEMVRKFCVRFASFVAWTCAAEATRRRKASRAD